MHHMVKSTDQQEETTLRAAAPDLLDGLFSATRIEQSGHCLAAATSSGPADTTLAAAQTFLQRH